MLALILADALAQLRTLDSLPNLGTGRHSVAYALNDAGDVVGIAQGVNYATIPVCWRSGIVTELGIFPGDVKGVALGVNDAGQACGQSIGVGVIRAVLWSGGSVTDLGHLGVPVASATALNDAGIVVGNSYPAGSQFTHGFRWHPATVSMSDLGTLGGAYSAAGSVDDAGNAYGVATDAAGRPSAVIWPAAGGPAVPLDALGVLGQSSIARGCSASGLVVGDGYDFLLGARGFVWRAAGGFQLLPHPPGTTVQRVQDVNDAGQLIVHALDQRMWIYDLGSGFWTDAGAQLPPFPRASVSAAYQINAAGQIAGHGYDFATGATQSAWLLSLAPDAFALGEPFPALAGEPNALGAAGATPGAALYVAAGFAAGVTAVPGCGGLTVAIHAPVVRASGVADAQGVARWNGLVAPAALAGRRLLLQAVELAACRASNLTSADFR
jgi:probable HAF family extracellular repeat protein